MEKGFKSLYIKRSQKDYSMSFKLSVVREVESGSIGVKAAARKYGIQGHGTITEWRKKYGTCAEDSNTVRSKFMQSPQQKLKELEQQLCLLERQNRFLSDQLTEAEDKAAILDKLVDLAEKEYLLPIRKNSSPDPSKR